MAAPPPHPHTTTSQALYYLMFISWAAVAITAAIFLLIDLYLSTAVKAATRSKSRRFRNKALIAFWTISLLVVLTWVAHNVLMHMQTGRHTRSLLLNALFIQAIAKIILLVFLLIEDIVRAIRWLARKFQRMMGSEPAPVAQAVSPVQEIKAPATAEAEYVKETEPLLATIPGGVENPDTISRSEFLSKVAIGVAATPAVALTWGIISGAHDYQVHRVKLVLPNLPREFEGLRLAQLSDIHSGSFFNKTAVKGGIDMLLAEKPDLVFFTGDLVNNEAWEIQEYIDIFDKVKAPLGVFSVLGNHDYGDYMKWWDADRRAKNLAAVKAAHAQMGWRLLNDEHVYLNERGEKLGIIGIGNWGTGRFPRYGNMAKAVTNMEQVPVKLLLSHDPSHWDGQVRLEYPEVDVQFAGHTHGMQVGIETKLIKWSPVQYRYKQWAGLYQEGKQQLYVNRGYGYIGYHGRLGILPEVTVFTLSRA